MSRLSPLLAVLAVSPALVATAEKNDAEPEFDRTRGQIVFKAKTGEYMKGEHFGRWNWPSFTPERWGMYMVEATYYSTTPQMGVQFYIGDAKVKSYLPQTGGMDRIHSIELGKLYIQNTETSPVGMLTGDNSDGPQFKLKHITLTPAQESEGELAQGIDGNITLHARDATTYSENLRYEPKDGKNCLGFWTNENDWAEWNFSVHDDGEFDLSVFQGCGGDNEGSKVALYLNDEKFTFTVEDTGGFQNFQEKNFGTVKLEKGDHRIAVKPLNKTNKAVMDIQKITLTPVSE